MFRRHYNVIYIEDSLDLPILIDNKHRVHVGGIAQFKEINSH